MAFDIRPVAVAGLVFFGLGGADAGSGPSGLPGGPASPAQVAPGTRASQRERVLSLVSDLVALSTPYGSSAADAQRLVSTLLQRTGFDVQLSTDAPDTLANHPEFMNPAPWRELPVNLVATPPRGLVSPVVLFAHIDTEAAGPGWTSPPTTAVIRDGRMYGLGTADSKAGVAAAVVAALALAEAGRPAPTIVIIHGKGGGARGSLPVFARLRGPRAAVYVHPAETGNGLAEVKHSSRGVLDLTLAVTGWQGQPREAGTPESAPFAEGGDALQACVQLVEAMRAQVPAEVFFNVGRLAAGDRPGTVPARCQADMRVLFETGTAEDIRARLEAALRPAAKRLESSRGQFTWSLTTPGTRSNPAGVAWDAPLCRLVRQSITTVTGTAPVSYTKHMTSDIRFPIRAAGMPSVGIGSKGGNFSRADEWIDVEDLVRLVDVLMLIVDRAGALPPVTP
jgi:acetylornithine deacetylase/succinyl-diaminopimelate desuccinylase-like protein